MRLHWSVCFWHATARVVHQGRHQYVAVASHQVLVRHLVLVIVVSCIQVVVVLSVVARVMSLCSHSFVVAAMAAARRAAAIYIAVVLPDICTGMPLASGGIPISGTW